MSQLKTIALTDLHKEEIQNKKEMLLDPEAVSDAIFKKLLSDETGISLPEFVSKPEWNIYTDFDNIKFENVHLNLPEFYKEI